jgi:ribosomal protein L31
VTRSPSDHSLADLADLVAEQFSDYRHSEEFNELSLVIDNSNREHPSLIVHIDGQQSADLAERVDAFLRNYGARTERERHDDTDIRILATLE